MHCNSCSMLVSDALKDMGGVKSANVSYEKGEAVVEFDEKMVDSERIIKEIKKAGYKAEEFAEKKKGFFGRLK